MKKILSIFSIIGFVTIGMSSVAAAQGGASGATLLPTMDALACTVDLTVPNCESDGFGSAATLKIGRANYLGVDVSNLITFQVYMVANNDVGTADCSGVLGSFTTGPAGGQTATFPVTSAAGFVSVCREVDSVLVPILTGQMGKLNGPG